MFWTIFAIATPGQNCRSDKSVAPKYEISEPGLQHHLIDHIQKQIFVIKKVFLQFHSLLSTFFLTFHFKQVLKKVGRKVVMEPVFSMDRVFKAQLCLYAPPMLPINLTQSDIKIHVWLKPESSHPLWEKLCSPLHH